MSTRVWRRTVALGLAAVLAGCTGTAASSSPTAEFRAVDLVTGNEVSLTDLRGRPALLTSWAVWCSACIEELPALETYHSTHQDSLRIVAVNVDGSRQSALRRARQDHLTMPVWHDPGNAFSRVFGLFGIPSWVLIDPAGRVVKVGAGPVDPTAADFQNLLASITQASP